MTQLPLFGLHRFLAYRVVSQFGVKWHPGDTVTLNGEPKPWLKSKLTSSAVLVDLNDPEGRDFYVRVRGGR